MSRFAWVVLSFVAACGLGAHALVPGPPKRHPIATYQARLVRTDDALTLTIKFDCDLLNLNHGIRSAGRGQFLPDDVEEAARGFLRLIENGTRLYDGDGRPMRLTSSDVTLAPLPGPITLGDFEATRGTIELRFPATTTPETCSILVDWGGWRRAVTTSLQCMLEDRGGNHARVTWAERTRYPLLPGPDDEPRFFLGEMTYSPEPLDETLTGYSYVYIENDHVRHELVLPLMALSGMLEFSPSAPSTAGDIETVHRRIIERELRSRFSSAQNLRSGDLPLSASQSVVRWFTRESLRRGVVTDDRPIPMATGFVGMLLLHPVAGNVADLQLDSMPCLEFVSDQVVTLVAGDRIERIITNHENPRASWQGSSQAKERLTPTTVNFEERTRAGWLSIVAALLVVLAICPLQSTRRWRPGLLILAILLIAADFNSVREEMSQDHHEVLQPLVAGMYRACGRQDEQESLALLTDVADSALLEDLYLELRGQLRGPWATGAGTDVSNVTLTNTETKHSERGFIEARCTWALSARIEHWGHVHDRTLEVEAQIKARARGERWRLEDVRLIDKRISRASSRPRR